MARFAEVNEKIAEKVVEGYKKIENGVVSGYKKIEDGAVVGFNRVKIPFDTTFTRISSYDSARTISRATVPFPRVTSVAKRVPKSSGNGALIITKSYCCSK